MFSAPRLSNRFFMSLALVMCLAAVILSGCDSNPSGTEASTTTTTTTTVPLTPSTGDPSNTTIYGSILDADSGMAIQNTAASIKVALYKDGVGVKTVDTLNNSTYSISGLPGGIYTVIAYDAATVPIYNRNYVVVAAAANNTYEMNIKIKQIPVVVGVQRSSLTFFGKLEDAVNGSPVMFATVKIGVGGNTAGGYETTTLADGYFFIYGVSSGTYTVTFSKTGYNDLSASLEVGPSDNTAAIRFGSTNIAYDAVGHKDGTGVIVPGYNLNTSKLSNQFVNTGALSGIIRNPATSAPLANSRFNLFYKRKAEPADTLAIIYPGFTTNSEGYFSMKNLPAGYYGIGDSNTTALAILDVYNKIVDWTIVGGVVYTGALLEVVPGNTTPLPSQ